MADYVGTAQWYQALNTATNSTAFPSAATDGVLVPSGKKAETVHVFVDANAGCSIRVNGMTSSKVASGFTTIGNRWGRLEDYSMPGATNYGWAEPLATVSAYERVDIQRTDQNANATVNAYIGFGEHWRSFGR